MPFGKPHREFFALDMEQGWFVPDGYPAGIEQKTLASDIDEVAKAGGRSRLLRFAPGAFTTRPFVHDHWEEVFLFRGDLTVGGDSQDNPAERFEAPTYACRPPGVYHGPFRSENGCLLFELHYYGDTPDREGAG